jgi:hypothetical protein
MRALAEAKSKADPKRFPTTEAAFVQVCRERPDLHALHEEQRTAGHVSACRCAPCNAALRAHAPSPGPASHGLARSTGPAATTTPGQRHGTALPVRTAPLSDLNGRRVIVRLLRFGVDPVQPFVLSDMGHDFGPFRSTADASAAAERYGATIEPDPPEAA